MSTTIITNQLAIKFSVKAITKCIEQNANAEQLLPLLETTYKDRFLFNKWQGEYVFLLEQYIESNVFPQEAKWNSFLPVSPVSDVINGYISKALTAFEGGMCRFKGSAHTKPEAALKKLRDTIDDAPSFDEFYHFNTNGLKFTFSITGEIDNQATEILKLLGFNLENVDFSEKSSKNTFNIHIRLVSQIIKVIVIDALASQNENILACRFIDTVSHTTTKSLLEKVA